MTPEAIDLAAALCRRFEGYYPRPYLCPAGVPTIGYGSTFYEDGSAVQLTDPSISRERAEQLLRWHLERGFAPGVMRACPRLWLETPGRQAALLDFAYNLGLGALRASTLRRVVNDGAWDKATAELLKWVRAGGVVLRGLVARREAEAALLDGSQGAGP